MVEHREIIRKIYGDIPLSASETMIAGQAIDWCRRNPEVLDMPVREGALMRVIDSALRDLYGKGIAYWFCDSRRREFVDTRNIVLDIYRKKERTTILDMEKIFGKHHSTIIHASKMVADLRSSDSNFERKYQEILNQIELCEKQLTSSGPSGSSQEQS